jgi:hypothetical protein
MRRGRNKAAVAVARKLCVAVWHVMQGHAIGAIERMDTLHTKLGKLATELGLSTIKSQGCYGFCQEGGCVVFISLGDS